MDTKLIATAVVTAALSVTGMAVFGPAAPADSASSYDREILRELEGIKYNTGAVCQDASHGVLCKKF